MNRVTLGSRLGGSLLAFTALALIAGGAGSTPMLNQTPAERLAALESRRTDLENASNAIIEGLGDNQDMTDAQTAEIEANATEIETIDRQIAALKRVQPAATGVGRRTTAEPQNRQPGAAGEPANPGTRIQMRDRQDPRGGFRSFGELAVSVRRAAAPSAVVDARLVNAASTFGNEGSGADGGYLVPPEFSREIWQKVMAEENLLGRCEPLITGANSMSIPKDETTPWQSSGGVQVYWEGEGNTIPPSKPAFELDTFRLVKLTALVPISDENLEDAIGLESWLRAKAPAKMAAKINTAIIRGTGAGMPLGILKAPSRVKVSKNASQPADSIWFENINNMWSRMYAPWRRNSIWLINQDCEPQLDAMAFDPQATAGKVPVYVGPSGAAGSPYATLKGRPVVPVEATSQLGDEGDIILVDLKQYWALQKASGVRTDTSIHLYFDQALTTFRFIFRLNGQPAWKTAITPENGSGNTRSWAVTLEDRT